MAPPFSQKVLKDRRLRDIPSAEMARRFHQEEKVASAISAWGMSPRRLALLQRVL